MSSVFEYIYKTAKDVDAFLDQTIQAINDYSVDWLDMAPECVSKVNDVVSETQQELIRTQNSIKDSYATVQVATTSPPVSATDQARQYALDLKSAADLLKLLAKLPVKIAIILMAVINKITELAQQAAQFSVNKLTSLITSLGTTLRADITGVIERAKLAASRYYYTKLIEQKTRQIENLARQLSDTTISDSRRESITTDIKKLTYEIETLTELLEAAELEAAELGAEPPDGRQAEANG